MTLPRNSKISPELKHKIYAVAGVTENAGDTTIKRRQGVVVSVEPSTHTCTVTLGGGLDALSEVGYLSSYYPVVNETVWVDLKGGDALIVGTSQDEWIQFSGTYLGLSTAGSIVSKYKRLGQTCMVQTSVLISGSGPNAIVAQVPPFAPCNDQYCYTGAASAGIGGTRFDGVCFMVPADGYIRPVMGNNYVDSSHPFVWHSGDFLAFNMTYEVAPGA